ncbi:neurofilament medium polypeptide-like [Macrobrachium nipponense]|uniref:neurofilament medium polypeptide-like n=1 Tax=Macrobrachium nipponense TaxID=159736 RepID=UPI0030C8852B
MEVTEVPAAGPFPPRQNLTHDGKVETRRILRPKRGLSLRQNLLNRIAEGSFSSTVIMDVGGTKRKNQETEERCPDAKRARTKEGGRLVAGNTPCCTPLLARNCFPRPEPNDVEEGLATVHALKTKVAPPKRKRRYVRNRAADRFPRVLRNTEGTKRKMEDAGESSPSNMRLTKDEDEAVTASPTRRPPLKARRGGMIKAAALRKRFADNSQRGPQDCRGRKRKLEEDEESTASDEQRKMEAAGKMKPLSKRRKADQSPPPRSPPKARKRLPRQAKANAVDRIHKMYGVPTKRTEPGQNAAAKEDEMKEKANEKVEEKVKKEAESTEAMQTDISPDEPQQKKLRKRKGKKEPPKKQDEEKQKKEKKMEAPKNHAEKKNKKKKEEPPKKQAEKRKRKGAKGPQKQEKEAQKPEAVTMSEAEVAELLKQGKKLGAGAYGTVYKVVHKGEVAVLKVANSRQWNVKAVFRREAKVLQALNGAGGAPLLFGTCSKPAAILMEYCPGEEFFSFINDSKNSPSLALGILPDIARKLHQIHLAGYIHVDLKTDNVMIYVREGKGKKQVKPRIIDFGLAVERGKEIEVYPNMSDSIYPPEYTEGAPAQPSGDVYSMGCLIEDTIYAFTDHIPQHYEEIINLAKNENPKLRPTVPKLVKLLEAARKKPNLQ